MDLSIPIKLRRRWSVRFGQLRSILSTDPFTKDTQKELIRWMEYSEAHFFEQYQAQALPYIQHYMKTRGVTVRFHLYDPEDLCILDVLPGATFELFLPSETLSQEDFTPRVASSIEAIAIGRNLPDLRAQQVQWLNVPEMPIRRLRLFGGLSYYHDDYRHAEPEAWITHTFKNIINAQPKPVLTELFVGYAPVGVDAIEALCQSPNLSALTVAVFNTTTLDDEAAHVIANCPYFESLERLVISNSRITDTGVGFIVNSPFLSESIRKKWQQKLW